MNYLEIARRARAGYEKDESDEKRSQNPAPNLAGTHRGSTGGGEIARRRAYRLPIEATAPPLDWDGMLPEPCGWPAICAVLGPCARSQDGRPCRLDAA